MNGTTDRNFCIGISAYFVFQEESNLNFAQSYTILSPTETEMIETRWERALKRTSPSKHTNYNPMNILSSSESSFKISDTRYQIQLSRFLVDHKANKNANEQ